MTNFKYIYGPVPSRRLGLSLGIDPFPETKTCTFNCIYCQLGISKPVFRRTLINTPEPSSIIRELEKFFKLSSADFVTFSGNGEPTLWAGIGDVFEFLKEKRPEVKRAVLTNGSMLWHPDVQDMLRSADVLVPTVSAGDEETFSSLHRPNRYITFDKWLDGLKAFSKNFSGEIWAEVMLVKGVNDSKEHLRKLKKIITEINPKWIDINTPVRPPAEKWVSSPTGERIEFVCRIFGEKCRVIGKFAVPSKKARSILKLTEEILSILKRRPERPEDIAKALGIDYQNMQYALSVLEKNGKIIQVGEYYKILQL